MGGEMSVSKERREGAVEDGGSEILGKLNKRAGTMYNLETVLLFIKESLKFMHG